MAVSYDVDSPYFYENWTNQLGTWSTSSPIQTRLPKTLGAPSAPGNPGANSGGTPNAAVPTGSFNGCPTSADSGVTRCMEGNPINAATGNKFQVETDFVGAPHTGLALQRYYNNQDTTASPFGAGWRSTYHRALIIPALPLVNYARLTSRTPIQAIRADGYVDTFTQNIMGCGNPTPMSPAVWLRL